MLNQYKIVGDVLVVYNRKDGREMLFDAEDFDLISKYTWHIGKKGYAVSSSVKSKLIYAHRLLMNFPKNKLVDHIDGDKKVDNRKSNLRIATDQINQHNQKNAKGYSWNKRVNKWKAYIKVNRKLIYLGHYNTEDEARAAYLQAKKIYHPSAPHHLYK